MDHAGENKIIARREIEDYEGNGDIALAPDLFASDYRLMFGSAPPMDQLGHAQLLAGLRSAFPDLRIRVAEQVGAGDRVANHWIAQGTQRGPFQGIPATGRAVTFTGNNLMHFAGGRIAALWGQLDAIGLLTQLGAMQGSVPPYEKSPDQIAAPGDRSSGGTIVVRRFVDNFNAGRIDAIADDFDDTYRLDFPGGPAGAGKDGIRDATRSFRAAFPDLHFATEDLFEEASRALPKFESYGMLEKAAFCGWKAKDAIERFHGIGRLVASPGAGP